MYNELMQKIFYEKDQIRRSCRKPEGIILSSDYVNIIVNYIKWNPTISAHFDVDKSRDESGLSLFGLPVYEVEKRSRTLKVF